MSKYIPGNQKHLTLNDRIYIESELAKETSFKDIAAFYAKIQQPYLKRYALTESLIGITKALFIIQRTFAFIVTTARRLMLVKKFSSVALSVLLVLPVIKLVEILKRNIVNA